MTRTEFVKAYAARFGLSGEWAILGEIEMSSGKVRIALPCACDGDGCQGWVMVSATGVDDHLRFRAPEKLRAAYIEAIGDRE